MDLLIEIIGWVGSAAVLLAYGLNTYQKLKSDSMTFYLLNFVSGILLIIYTIYKEAFANTFINAVWAVIAGVAIVKFFIDRKSKT
jgi:hypothetical protein